LDPPHYFTKGWFACLSAFSLILLTLYVASLCLATDSFILNQAIASNAYFVFSVDITAILSLIVWMAMGAYLYRTQKFLSLPVKLGLAAPLLLMHVLNINMVTLISTQNSAAVDTAAKALVSLMRAAYYTVYSAVTVFLLSQLLANFSER